MSDAWTPDASGPWTTRRVLGDHWVVVAGNPGPLTLDGTNSYVLRGGDGCVLVDPGPDLAEHRAALAERCAGLRLVLLTHAHEDHSEIAFDLADAHGVPVRAADPAWCLRADPLLDGEPVALGAGSALEVVVTPGHTADSASFVLHRRAAAASGMSGAGAPVGPAVAGTGVCAVLSGDLLLGRGTTFVGHPQGRLVDYLRSLDRLGAVVDHATLVLPGHGPVREDAAALVSAYRAHRLERLDQVRSAWLAGARSTDDVLEAVYGPLRGTLRAAARASTQAQLAYLNLLRDP